MNVSCEYSAVRFWGKVGSLYRAKSLLSNLFLQKKLFHLRVDENENVIDNLNVHNTLVSQITSIGIKTAEEDKCITLLCSFLNSLDILIIAIGNSSQETLKFDEIVLSLLS